MGRNVRSSNVLTNPPVLVSGVTRVAVGVSLTSTLTIASIDGAGVLGLLAIDNATVTSNATKVLVQVSIDGTKCHSATASISSIGVNVVGYYGVDGYSGEPVYAFEAVPFNTSVRVALKSIGQETSMSLVSAISFRMV